MEGNNSSENGSGYEISDPIQITRVATWFFILTFAVIMNSLVVSRVFMVRKLHSPTFVVLCSLSISDMLYVILFVLLEDTTQMFIGYNNMISEDVFYVLVTVNNIVAAASAWHLVVLSVLRYYIIVHPLKAKIWLTTAKTIVICALTWLMCGVLSVAITIIYIYTHHVEHMATVHAFCTYMLTFIVPFIVILLFDVSKLRELSRTIKEMRTCKKSKAKLSRMVYLILILFGCFCIPRLILSVICSWQDLPWCTVSFEISGYLYVMNSCVNPVIYCFLSPAFQKSLKAMFICCKDDPHRRTMSFTSTG